MNKDHKKILSDIRRSVAFLSISGFIGYLIIASSLTLEFIKMNREGDTVALESIGRIFCYMQIAGVVALVLFLLFGIKKVVNLQNVKYPKVILTKGFSRFFMVIGMLGAFILILFYLPLFRENVPAEPSTLYKTTSFYSRIIFSYIYAWFILTYWLRKKGSIYAVPATTSFSIFPATGSTFPFGIIILIVWLFFRKAELANLKEALGIDQNDKKIST